MVRPPLAAVRSLAVAPLRLTLREDDMQVTWSHRITVAALLLFTAATASAQATARHRPVLYGTTGACNNATPSGPCTTTSTLVQIDPATGALLRTIGPVGYTVNGLAWDRTARPPRLYATTAVGDLLFHGLITIDPATGAGAPVDPAVANFGLAGEGSPIHSIAIDPIFGTMQAWYEEFGPDATDTFVWINKRTGVATEFPNSGIDTKQNGLAWQALPTRIGRLTVTVPHLWNIDIPRVQEDGSVLQLAYEINPLPFDTLFGQPVQRVLGAHALTPPTIAALGDFNPADDLYYGLSLNPFNAAAPNTLVKVDPQAGTVTVVGTTLKDLHVIAFVKP